MKTTEEPIGGLSRMALTLSQLVFQAYADRLATAFHVVLAGCVFAFLAMMITLS